MNKILWYISGILLVVFTGCSPEELPTDTGQTEIRFYTFNQENSTRAENLTNGSTVRILVYPQGAALTTAPLAANTYVAGTSGQLTPCTVNTATGAYTGASTTPIRLAQGRYDVYAVSPAIQTTRDATGQYIHINNGTDYAVSQTTVTINNAATQTVQLNTLQRKCTMLAFTIKRKSSNIKKIKVNSVSLTSMPQGPAKTYIPGSVTPPATFNQTITIPVTGAAQVTESGGTMPTVNGSTLILPRNTTSQGYTLNVNLDITMGTTSSSALNHSLSAPINNGTAGAILRFEEGKKYLFDVEVDGKTITLRVSPWNTVSWEDPNFGLPQIKLDNQGSSNSYIVETTVGKCYSFGTSVRGNGVVPPAPGSGYYGTTSHATTNTGAAYAEVIWQDVNGLITDVSYSNNRVSFKKSGAGSGNAVIGIKTSAAATTYIWSWHIWVTDAPLTHQFNNLTWMDRNLGATTNTYDAAGKVKGLLYQWGRKDPFPSGTNWTNTEPPLYGARTSITKTAVAATNNLANAIGNPVIFYTGADWATNGSSRTTQHDNLWGSTTNDNTGKKTLYDPCPPGWKVPYRNAWTTPVKLTTTSFPWNQTGYTNGRIINATANSYYPASGYRNDSSGTLLGSSLSGYYWSSAPSGSTSNGVGLMNFTNTVMTSQNSGYRTFGFFVRCVKE